jgi:hypothetical protein
MFLHPHEIDKRLNWPLGTAKRLAKRRRLPHYVLPDGAIRFRWEEIESLIRRIAPASPTKEVTIVAS